MTIELTKEIIDELIEIDFENLTITFKPRGVHWFVDGYHSAETVCKWWNSKNAGKKAEFKSGRYAAITLLGKERKVHRLVWFYKYGYWSKEIDHKNGNPKDWSLNNLREVTHSENMKNQKLHSTNRSGHAGIGFVKRSGKWRVRMTVNTIKIVVGTFDTLDEAIVARDIAYKQHRFYKNHGKPLDFNV